MGENSTLARVLLMIDCFVHTFPGEEIKLVKNSLELDDLRLAEEAIACLREFSSFVQPLAADLIVRCRDQDWLFVDEAEPSFSHWYIRASSLPVGVTVMSKIKDSQVSEKPNLSPEILLDWIRTALNQDYSNSEICQMTWWQLEIGATRARIFNEKAFESRQFFALDSDMEELHLPLEYRDDGLWVSGSTNDLLGGSPFAILLTQEYGGLSITIYAHWSLWTQPNSMEHSALQRAISRLISTGWELFPP
jgi:hypothetical protein